MSHPVEDLIKLCQKNDRKAQYALYGRFCDYAMNICYRFAANIEEAQDMVQNTFVRVFTHIQDYDSQKGSFVAWLHQIALREAMAVRRKKMHWQSVELAAVEYADSQTKEDIIDKMTLDEMESLVRKLPESHRIILLLYYFDDCTHEEIADILGIGVSSSRSRLTRARAELLHQWNHLYCP